MIINMVGKRYGKLLVSEYAGIRGKAQHATWVCLCDCGNTTTAVGSYIRAGRITSCGCNGVKTRFSSESLTTHGMSKTRTYHIWQGIIARTTRKTNKSHLYFDKGITVCDEWKSFDAFLKDMGEAPDGLSIDRINSNLGYSPENCRWATAEQQANNTSRNKLLTAFGKTMTLAAWAKSLNIKPNTLLYRIKRKWPIEKALSN